MFCVPGGGSASDDHYAQTVIARSYPEAAKADQEDRARGASLGLVIFASGVLSFGIGAGLHYLAERGIFG